jgi:hypothetical protein
MGGELAEYIAALVLTGAVAILILRSESIVRALGRVIDGYEERTPGARPDRPPPPPLPGFSRPIELIAHDVHRLRWRFRTLPERGVAYAKKVAVRRAYDGALVEACQVLEIVTLLGVLPDGPELDVERERVEGLLDAWGFGREADAA